jgi:transposase
MGHRRGESREQAALFPVMLDELVPQDGLVRVVDAWVGGLDLKALGFQKAQAKVMGAPPYDPGDLLKLYVWGYLSAVRSSRELEKECHRNVECMWLLGRLAPDHKTIADFRRNNSNALVAACADGSKVRAVASRKAVIQRKELQAQAQRNAQEIERYLSVLDAADREEGAQPQPQAQDIRRALKQLEDDRDAIQANLQQLAEGRSALVASEPDAQVMHALHGTPGYNLQTAVDTQSHLIVAHTVTNEAYDQRQLAPMAQAVTQAIGTPTTVLADGGYANGEHIGKLEAQGITSYVPVIRAVNQQGDGRLYDKTEFVYDSATDSYRCPADKLLKRKQVAAADHLVLYAARAADCGACPNKPSCTTAQRRHVSRHMHEDALERCRERTAQCPQMMALRKQTVEHPFDFIKNRVLINARLLMRGLPGAAAELSLAVLAYNLKRVFNMKGSTWMRQAVLG